jgi:hypothetical protein
VSGASDHLPALIAGVLAALWVLLNLDAPLVEDSLFWWVPKALLAAEQGLSPVLAHTLPAAVQAGLEGGPTPHQWADGLPDYAHPPLWYGWLALFLKLSPTVQAVHMACLLPAILAAVGFARLGVRLGSRWSGLAVLALPPVLAQFLRPELDLPLLALTPWFLLALVDRRWGHVAWLGLLAPWLKEPGVLLVVPALMLCLQERRLHWQALAPLVGLGLWSLVHGGLAQPESLPATLAQIPGDALLAARIVFFEQGRWLLLLGVVTLGKAEHRPLVALVATWVLFFACVGFFAGRGQLEPLTHVRYFLPGMAVGVLLLAQRWPVLALVGLLFVHQRSPYGPEASLYGIDVARAEAHAAPWIRAQSQEHPVWVGAYTLAGLTQPWAGRVESPIRGLRVHDPSVPPGAPQPGDILVGASHGDPTTRFERALRLTRLDGWTHREAQVVAWRVEGARSAP